MGHLERRVRTRFLARGLEKETGRGSRRLCHKHGRARGRRDHEHGRPQAVSRPVSRFAAAPHVTHVAS